MSLTPFGQCLCSRLSVCCAQNELSSRIELDRLMEHEKTLQDQAVQSLSPAQTGTAAGKA